MSKNRKHIRKKNNLIKVSKFDDFLKQFVFKIFITFLLTHSYSSQVQPKTLLTTSNKKYIQLPIFSQSSIVLMTMIAATRDFAAQMVHACVNQDGRAIWIAQVT